MIINSTEQPLRYVKGELHSTDASAGVAVTLYERGTLSTTTVAATERLCITAVLLVTAAGGDSFVFVGADNTEGNGEYVVRGTFAANGGVNTAVVEFMGGRGHTPFAQAPAGVVDVIFYGYII